MITTSLKNLVTAAEFGAAVVQLRLERAAAEQTVAEIGERLKSAPFEGSAESVLSLRQERRDAQERVELLGGVLEEAQRREAAARQTETRAYVEGQRDKAMAARARMASALGAILKHAGDVAAALTSVEIAQDELRAANAAAREHGLPDLVVSAPQIAVGGLRGVVGQLTAAVESNAGGIAGRSR